MPFGATANVTPMNFSVTGTPAPMTLGKRPSTAPVKPKGTLTPGVPKKRSSGRTDPVSRRQLIEEVIVQLFLIDTIHDFYENSRGITQNSAIYKVMNGIRPESSKTGGQTKRSVWDLLNYLYLQEDIGNKKYINLAYKPLTGKSINKIPIYLKQIKTKLSNKIHENFIKNTMFSSNPNQMEMNYSNSIESILNNIIQRNSISYSNRNTNVSDTIQVVKHEMFYKLLRIGLANGVTIEKTGGKEEFSLTALKEKMLSEVGRNNITKTQVFYQIDSTNISLSNTLLRKLPPEGIKNIIVTPSIVFDATKGVSGINRLSNQTGGSSRFTFAFQTNTSMNTLLLALLSKFISLSPELGIKPENIYYQGKCDGLTNSFHYFFHPSFKLNADTNIKGISFHSTNVEELQTSIFIMVCTKKNSYTQQFKPVVITNSNPNPFLVNESYVIESNYILCRNLSNLGVNSLVKIANDHINNKKSKISPLSPLVNSKTKDQNLIQITFDFKRVLDRFHYIFAYSFHKKTGIPLYTLTHDYLSCGYGLTAYPYIVFVTGGSFYILTGKTAGNLERYKNKYKITKSSKRELNSRNRTNEPLAKRQALLSA